MKGIGRLMLAGVSRAKVEQLLADRFEDPWLDTALGLLDSDAAPVADVLVRVLLSVAADRRKLITEVIALESGRHVAPMYVSVPTPSPEDDGHG